MSLNKPNIKCSSTKKILETIDLSNNGKEVYYKILHSSFFKCARFKNVLLRNNRIKYIKADWKIFHSSLKTIDLSQNEITELSVSAIFFKKIKIFKKIEILTKF